jgi:RNA polymerase sigma-70 factor (ECF subfamily)
MELLHTQAMLGFGVIEDISTISDEELLSRSMSEPRYFSYIVSRYEEAFLRRARSVLFDNNDAEDCVQEVFLKIYRYGGRFHSVEGATFRSWAYRILMNTAITHYTRKKKKGHNMVPLDPEIYESFPDVHNEADVRVTAEFVRQLLGRLPEGLARPLRLFFIEEYSQQEIASMEGMSVAAVKTRIYRGKREMAHLASEQGDLLPSELIS